jgi:sporulation protein YlmC with PRC-barrel domain
MKTLNSTTDRSLELKPNSHQTASSIIGRDIFNSTGETLGSITDIMIDTTDGKVVYLIIQFGGFLGINQKSFAVPMQALTPAKEHLNAYILNETKESMNHYPRFNKEHWADENAGS